jgi:hypothetical protein
MAFTLLKNAAQSLRERLQVKDLENTAPALRHWLQSDFGRYLQVRERRVSVNALGAHVRSGNARLLQPYSSI